MKSKWRDIGIRRQKGRLLNLLLIQRTSTKQRFYIGLDLYILIQIKVIFGYTGIELCILIEI